MELASFEEAERLKIQGPEGDAEEKQRFRDNLLASADPICSEIERSIDYFRSTYGGSEIKVILLSGGSANIPGLADNLRQRLNIETEIMNPFKKIGYNQKQFTAEEVERIGPSAAVCVGLALRKLGDK